MLYHTYLHMIECLFVCQYHTLLSMHSIQTTMTSCMVSLSPLKVYQIICDLIISNQCYMLVTALMGLRMHCHMYPNKPATAFDCQHHSPCSCSMPTTLPKNKNFLPKSVMYAIMVEAQLWPRHFGD